MTSRTIDHQPGSAGGSAPTASPGLRRSLTDRLWVAPTGPKVPEIIAIFWAVKILTTAGGEVTSDYLARYGNVVGGGLELAVFAIGLILQFGTRRYRALSYWWLAFSIAIFGTGVADFLHLDVHISWLGNTVLWAVILAAIFWAWHRSQRTLSIHSIHTRRREFYYWATVFATFALGTALGDYTAIALNLGFFGSGIFFGVAIVIPWVLHRWAGLNGVLAFWLSYVLTRPLGASFADWVSKPASLGGLHVGNGTTAAITFAVVVVLVAYLAVARPDIQGGGVEYAEV